ncbi:oligosaccharide flippase family protein [Candidatus Parcubacteria bacterium]|nr:oligosaccharide flippase family protein [Candidatus Parcubacteria bacterium]MBI4385255.1 oligosaccharide flippase family protein [Candidatus Parcubacteria bacterium]
MTQFLGRIGEQARTFAQHRFVRDTATLQAGTFISLGLGLISSVVFARALQLEGFGEYALISAIAAVASIPLDLGVGYGTLTLMAAAHARGDRDAVRDIATFFVKATALIALGIGVPVMVGTWLFTAVVYHSPTLGLLTVPLLAVQVLTAFFIFITIVYQVQHRLTALVVVENVNRVLVMVFPVTLVLLGYGLLGIVVGQFAAALTSLGGALFLYRRACVVDPLLPSSRDMWGHFGRVRLGKYFRFSFKIAFDKSIANLFATLPVMFLGRLAPVYLAGYYRLAFSYLQVPMRLTGSVSRLLQIQLPQSYVSGADTLIRHFRKVTVYSGLLSLCLVAGAIILAGPLITLVYGSSYAAAAKVVYVLVPFAVVSGFSVGMGPVFRAIDRVGSVIAINLATLAIVTPIGYWLVRTYHVYGAAALLGLYTAVATGAALLVVGYHFRRLSRSDADHARE